MIKRIDRDYVRKHDELLPGGDIRMTSNQWIRAAFVDSGIENVPRENRVREAVTKLVKKKKLGAPLSVFFDCATRSLPNHFVMSPKHSAPKTAFPPGLEKDETTLEQWIVDQALIIPVWVAPFINV